MEKMTLTLLNPYKPPMNTPKKLFRSMVPILFLFSIMIPVGSMTAAEGPYRNRDNPNPNDAGEGTYQIPYQLPTKEEILQSLQRVRDFMEAAAPTEAILRSSGERISDPAGKPVADATIRSGPEFFSPFAYEMGVVHSGMLRVSAVTQDPSFAQFTERHMQFIQKWTPYFSEAEQRFQLDRRNPFRKAFQPRALDDSGAMGAALIRARKAGIGPDLMEQIGVWTRFIAEEQFRLSDGTLARQRPQPQSLWADDAYMCIPALAEMGSLTGDNKWYDDAVQQALQMSKHLFVPSKGLYTHGLHLHNPNVPPFFWARANGWVVVALCDLLDVLPETHPGYKPVLQQLQAVLRGVAEYQDGNSGLWHQMIDRNNSYLETSASAMFVYGLARAVNQGWICGTTYGTIAQIGWIGVSQRINEMGQVEGTCVGTTLASDQVYYYHRPTSVYALHGYGPVLLAGAEVIRMLENPAYEIHHKLRTYHYVPVDGGDVSYWEHQ
jgi:unsaturated rhamnogalacturonyl hydrolase